MDISFRKLATVVAAIMLAAFCGVRAEAALPENLIVERLGEERGFPSGTITALYRDRAGFLWVGSREGLALWDGYSIRGFEHEVGNAASLPDNSIRVLYEDRAGRLWVGTNTGGLARLDRTNGKFEVLRHDPADPTSLSHASVYAIAECPDGSLWVGTQEGLNRLDPKTRKFERLTANASDPSSLPHDYVYALKLADCGSQPSAAASPGSIPCHAASRAFQRCGDPPRKRRDAPPCRDQRRRRRLPQSDDPGHGCGRSAMPRRHRQRIVQRFQCLHGRFLQSGDGSLWHRGRGCRDPLPRCSRPVRRCGNVRWDGAALSRRYAGPGSGRVPPRDGRLRRGGNLHRR
jgi:hypothetical protein